MVAVLGIDAAWTEHEPSGIALLSEDAGGWRCVAVAPSYETFLVLAGGTPVPWADRLQGLLVAPAALLGAAEKMLGGRRVDVIAVDMPLCMAPITGRRAADNAVSSSFGRHGCGTHSPSLERPGRISNLLRDGFAGCGYYLATKGTAVDWSHRLIEVYPHPALLALMKAQYRVAYKVSKAARYWPATSITDRARSLCSAFATILAALKGQVRDITLELPDPSAVKTLAALKRYEDAIDALVCAWVGTKYLVGEATAYGDDVSAIWVPKATKELGG